MEKLGWLGRLAVVLSGLWLLVVYALAPAEDATKAVVGFGLIPLGLIWGVAWAFQGYRKQRTADPETPPVNWKPRVLRIGAGFLAVCAGYIAAHLAVGDAAARIAGYWIVFALIFYGVVRLVPFTAKHGLLWTVVAYSLAVASHAYIDYLEVRQLRQDLANAAPLILRINSGNVPSQEEISRAQMGVFEPFVRASALHVAENLLAVNAYQKQLEALEIDTLLGARTLGQPEGRRLIAQRMDVLGQAIEALQTAIHANTERLKDQVAVLSAKLPAGFAAGLKRGLADRLERQQPLLRGWLDTQRQFKAKALDLSSFVDSLGQRVTLAGQPPQLIFADRHNLNVYDAKVQAFIDLAKVEAQWQQRMLDEEKQSATRLVGEIETQ